MKESGVYYDKEIRAVVVAYSGFLTTGQFMEIAEELQELSIKNHSTRQLSNIEEMGVLTPEIQKWLHDAWFPKAKLAGLKTSCICCSQKRFWQMEHECYY
ncbi:MAG TPA: hypothetical protein VMV56_03890 [Williamwhitmania sp.]|nr:hypothetical protein [Williamwhitmania sp.]